jgi:hypothetical protein
MLPDTGIDDVKKQRNAEYAKHINGPVLSSLKMEGTRLLFYAFSVCLATPSVTRILRRIVGWYRRTRKCDREILVLLQGNGAREF